MRSRTILILVTVLLMLPVAGQAAGLQIPAFETETLPNGLTLQLLVHPTVPMVSFDLWIRGGASADPAGKEGLAYLTGEALRKGAGDRDAAAFAEAMDFLGASFSTSVNRDRTRVTLSLLSKDFDAGLELLADAILRPTFSADEIGKLAGQSADAVVQAKDNPRNVLADYHNAFLYGSHPYGNPVDGTETSLKTMTVEDVKGFYRDHMGADRVILTVAGDIEPAEAKRRIEAAFGSMQAAAVPAPVIPEPQVPTARRVLLVNKNDTPQTWFLMGSLGPRYDHPDHAATEVVRTVFGGRFTSWLNNALRIESGLTYGARYTMSPGQAAGPAYISSFTATETTKEAMDMALAQLDRLHEEGIGEADLASAKAYLLGQTPYDYETAANMAQAISELTFYGVSRDRLDGLFDAVQAVDLEACREVIGKYFGRENLVITAIGVQAEVGEVLEGFGPLTLRENTEPGFRVPAPGP